MVNLKFTKKKKEIKMSKVVKLLIGQDKKSPQVQTFESGEHKDVKIGFNLVYHEFESG